MRLPAHCRLLSFSVAACALASGTPLLARGEPANGYAQGAPVGTILFRSDPVVQPLPQAPGTPAVQASDEAEDYEAAQAVDMPPPLPPAPPRPMPPLTAHAVPSYVPPPPGYPGGPVDGAIYPPYPGAYAAPGYAHPMPGYGYPASYPGYGYAQGGYMMVPVLVAIPQRQVVRETVTEEWVDAPVRARTISRTPPRPAPRGDKRIKGN